MTTPPISVSPINDPAGGGTQFIASGNLTIPFAAAMGLPVAFVSAGFLSVPLVGNALLPVGFNGIGVLVVPMGRTPVRVWSACVVQQPGLPAFALVGRLDANTVSVIDLLSTPQWVNGMRYVTRPMISNLPYHMRSTMGEQEPRAGRKRARRIRVYGEGTLTAGSTITLHADGLSETYPCSGADSTRGILIYQEFTPAMLGRILSMELFLNGTGIVIRDTELDYIFVG